jgi:hypothetical protein
VDVGRGQDVDHRDGRDQRDRHRQQHRTWLPRQTAMSAKSSRNHMF